MGCCNAEEKQDYPKELGANNKKENLQNNNQEEIKNNLDDHNNYDIYKNKYDGNKLIKEEDKGILNMYTNEIIRPKKYKVPNIIIINPKAPEDKKPPDINKEKQKEKIKKA